MKGTRLPYAVFVIASNGRPTLWQWKVRQGRLAATLKHAKKLTGTRAAFAIVRRDDNETLTFNASRSTCRVILERLD